MLKLTRHFPDKLALKLTHFPHDILAGAALKLTQHFREISIPVILVGSFAAFINFETHISSFPVMVPHTDLDFLVMGSEKDKVVGRLQNGITFKVTTRNSGNTTVTVLHFRDEEYATIPIDLYFRNA